MLLINYHRAGSFKIQTTDPNMKYVSVRSYITTYAFLIC